MLEISRLLFVNTVKKDCYVRWPSQNRDHHKFMAHCCKVFVLILNNKVLLRSYSFGNSAGHMLRNPKVADRDGFPQGYQKFKVQRPKCLCFKLDCCCLKKGSVVTSQCPRTDLNKRFLPRPKTITAWKLIPHRSKISKN